jgi:hypothetical protein
MVVFISILAGPAIYAGTALLKVVGVSFMPAPRL